MIKCIYRLLHEYSERTDENGEPLMHTIELGYFSTRKKVRDIINKYKNLKGFNEHDIKCFKVKKIILMTKKLPKSVFELYHSYTDNLGYVEYQYLGAYISEKKANDKQLKLMRRNHIYREFSDGFEITEEFIDSDNTIWELGFDKLNENQNG